MAVTKRTPSRRVKREDEEARKGRLNSRRTSHAKTYNDLDLLRDFLNIDFNAPPHSQANHDSAHVISFFRFYSSEDSLAEARSIQSEIISDLAFVTDQGGTNEKKIADGLMVLVDLKIRECDFRYRLAYQQIHGEPPPLLFTQRQKILNLHGTRWIVRTTYTPGLSLREQFYWTIASRLENGSISKLQRCLECQKFFLIRHGNQKVCEKCEKVRETKGVRERMRRYRETRRKQRADLLKKKGMPRLERFIALARKRELSDADEDEIFKIDNDREIFEFVVEKNKENWTPNKMWENMPIKYRKILAGIRVPS
jgi:hypothetical protein